MVKTPWIHIVADPRKRGKRDEIGGIGKSPFAGGVEKRFFTKSVAGEVDLSFGAVEHGEGKHTVQALQQSVDSPMRVTMRQDFGVAVADEQKASLLQFLFKERWL